MVNKTATFDDLNIYFLNSKKYHVIHYFPISRLIETHYKFFLSLQEYIIL